MSIKSGESTRPGSDKYLAATAQAGERLARVGLVLYWNREGRGAPDRLLLVLIASVATAIASTAIAIASPALPAGAGSSS
jgi:hypothetical protein